MCAAVTAPCTCLHAAVMLSHAVPPCLQAASMPLCRPLARFLPCPPAVGEAAAEPYGVYIGTVWVWTGIAFCVFTLIILSWAGVVALTYTQPPKPRPTGG